MPGGTSFIYNLKINGQRVTNLRLSGENVTKINGLIDRFGTPELKDALRMTGAANNPHIFKFLAKFASAYSEASPVAAGDSGHATSPAIAAGLSRMYPSAAGAA